MGDWLETPAEADAGREALADDAAECAAFEEFAAWCESRGIEADRAAWALYLRGETTGAQGVDDDVPY